MTDLEKNILLDSEIEIINKNHSLSWRWVYSVNEVEALRNAPSCGVPDTKGLGE